MRSRCRFLLPTYARRACQTLFLPHRLTHRSCTTIRLPTRTATRTSRWLHQNATSVAHSTFLSAHQVTMSLQSLRFVLHNRSLSDTGLTPQQARYSSPSRLVPGYWPEDISFTEDTTASSSSSVFSTLTRFATSLTLEVWKIPERLIQRFTRPLQIRAVPVITGEGASKRRLIDAGHAPATATRKVSPGGRQDPNATQTPKVWIETPPTPPNLPTTFLKSPEYNQSLQDVDIDDIDDSLDWSMDDVDSSTPSHNPKTGSTTGAAWLRQSSSPSIPKTGSLTGATCLRQTERKIITPRPRIFSPNTHFAMLGRSKATPMQKQLLKNQLRFVDKVSNVPPVSRQQNHTMSVPLTTNLTISELEKKILESSVLSHNAAVVAANAQEASARYRAELEARQNQDADAQRSE